jgi:hypothetical protein
MTDILVRCPQTGIAVSTGLKAEWVVVASLPLTIPLRCPSCGGTHHWKPSEAWIGAPPHQDSNQFISDRRGGDRRQSQKRRISQGPATSAP